MADNQHRRSSRVGAFLAAAVLPRTFQRSLLPRDTIDQGLSSGLVMAIVYAIAVVMQDGIDLSAQLVAQNQAKNPQKSQANYSLLMSFAAVGAGLLLQNAFKQREQEKLNRATARTAGYWLTSVGAAGATVGLLENVPRLFADDENHNPELPILAIPLIGALIAAASEQFRPNKVQERAAIAAEKSSVRPFKAIGIGVGVAAVIGTLTIIEDKAARGVDSVVSKYTPILKHKWLPFGHAFALGGLAVGVTWFMRRTYRKIESGNEQMEPAISATPSSTHVSGSIDSFAPWETLSVQGRRHIADQRSLEDINEVMGTQDAIEPIRLYVGFDTAPTESERVELALQELRRSKAYDREFLVVVSPTGTGYVNYVFSQSVEYLSRGNCASITIQYAKRPSPLSLDQVPEGRHHYRMLLNGIRRDLKTRPTNKRPKIILFGESLGAWTSQDAFMGEGTDGFDALNIYKALWIGTPAGSKWKEQVLFDHRLNTNREEIGVFNDFHEYLIMPSYDKKQLRYIMITHYNDPVAHFDSSLLLQAPKWLASDRRKRPTTVPTTTRWRPVTTFVHTLVDMKNALKPIPGQFVATGHDYRGDLANFVKILLDASVTDSQMHKLEAALRRNEKFQAELLATTKNS